MSLDKIQKLIGSLAKTVEDNHKIATPILAAKLAKYIEVYPHDQTIGTMSRVIEKMASNNTLFICRADLKDLYKRLYSTNTKFAEVCADELGTMEELATPTVMQRDDSEIINTYEISDPILSNALASVFDKNIPLKMYSQALADNAKRSVSDTLDSFGLKPTSLNINDGSEKFLVLKADYETPKGITSFYIPMEITNNKVVEASIFMGNSGPQEINHNNIKQYVTSNAGTKLRINASIILEALTKSASNNVEISGAELALTKLNATRQGKSEFFQNQIVGQTIDEESKKDIEIQKSDEFISFEKQFSSPVGLASLKFGDINIKTARSNIIRELTSFGYKNPQVVVMDHNDNSVFYGVSLSNGGASFTIPVKMADNKISKPSIMICNGSILEFNQESINSLQTNNMSDYKVAAVASPLFGLAAHDLINNIREAIKEGNNAKAEDALNVLANGGDEKAYASGFQLFLQGLGPKTASAKECKCSMIMESKTSQHPICGHTGLPLHKVYQDKHGNCRPLYRQGMDETYQGASFMNAKIFG